MKIFKYTLFLFLITSLGCDESKLLNEVPLDFYSPENSFKSYNNFKSGIYKLYDKSRQALFVSPTRNGRDAFDLLFGTDLVNNGQPSATARFTDYAVYLTPTSETAYWPWERFYGIISGANIIINRIPAGNLTDSEKKIIEAEARFFRGFSYRALAYLFGDVPLELEEVTTPRTNYTRTDRRLVLQQAAIDLDFAANELPGITAVKDGEISNLAAAHYLSEVYIALQEWDKAIAAATKVIDDPNTSLMTQRFGAKRTQPGDVYWDLFQLNNQNRSTSGNLESIWVCQFETDVLGGEASSSGLVSGAGGYLLERYHSPQVYQITAPDKVAGFIGPTSGATGGRGVGWMPPSNHFKYTVWKSDFNNDIRNSSYNFVRDFYYNNPASTYYGKSVLKNPPATLDTIRTIYPYQTKAAPPGSYPDNLYSNKATGLLLNTAGGNYTDQYYVRLAETYLLRAEAYLGKANTTAASADINVVRSRAAASPATPAQININYILDERMRELGVEERRRLTLARLGLVYERTVKYNESSKGSVKAFHNLYPIPFSEIERNVTGTLKQNEGY